MGAEAYVPTRDELKTTLNQVAADYDEVRPGYPEELIDDVISLARLSTEDRILEVGCGTGLATRPFAQRGYNLLSIDIGPDMVELAERNLSSYPNVTLQCVSFEDLDKSAGDFDLMISASAFHWIDPKTGYQLVANRLARSGAMAIFTHYHPPPYEGFFDAVQDVYQRVVPEWPAPREGAPIETTISKHNDAIYRSGAFGPVTVKTYPWSRDLTTAQYLKLLNAFSEHRLLEPSRRADLFDGVANLIDKAYGGIVSRPYMTTLYFAHKR